MTRICALLVFLISSPLLYFVSTPVVASSLVTISFTVAFIGSCNKHTTRPPLPFDPSPPLVMHIINVTILPPKYSTRCITFVYRLPRPLSENKPPDPILFALTHCTVQVSWVTAQLIRLTLKLVPPHPILHYLARYTTLHCLHPTANIQALTQALHTGISLHQQTINGVVQTMFQTTLVWETLMDGVVVTMCTSRPQRCRK